MAINQAWCVAATIATDLLCWLRLLCLDGPLADAEPKTLRYRLLHTAARIVRGQRKRKIKIPETWPWAHELEASFLATSLCPLRPDQPYRPPSRPEEPTGPWNRRPRRDRREHPHDPHPKRRSQTEVKITNDEPRPAPTRPVNDQGQVKNQSASITPAFPSLTLAMEFWLIIVGEIAPTCGALARCGIGDPTCGRGLLIGQFDDEPVSC